MIDGNVRIKFSADTSDIDKNLKKYANQSSKDGGSQYANKLKAHEKYLGDVATLEKRTNKVIDAVEKERSDLSLKYSKLSFKSLEKEYDAHHNKIRTLTKALSKDQLDDTKDRIQKQLAAEKSLTKELDIEYKKRPEVARKGAGAERGILGIGREITGAFGISGSQLGTAGGAIAAVLALKNLGEAGLEADARINKLQAGLQLSGTAVGALDTKTNLLVQTTAKLARTYSINNIELQQATAHFLELGGSQEDLSRKQQAIILLAEKAGKTLEEAATYAVKGFDEDLNLKLTRFGIALDKTLPPAEQFNQFMAQGAPLLDAMSKRFDTAAGRAARAKNDFETLKEGLASFVVNTVSNLKTAAESLDEFFDRLLNLQNKEEIEADRVANGGKARSKVEIETLDKITSATRRGEFAFEDYLTAKQKALGVDSNFAQFAPGYKGPSAATKTGADIKSDLNTKLETLKTDLENKRAVAVQAMEDHNRDAQSAAEKEVKIAGDKVNKLQAEFDRQNKIGGQDSGSGKKPKTAKEKAQEKYDEQKAANNLIHEQEINDAYNRFFFLDHNEKEWQKAKDAADEKERQSNIQAVYTYYRNLKITDQKKLDDAVKNDKDYQAIIRSGNEAKDKLYQEDLAKFKKYVDEYSSKFNTIIDKQIKFRKLEFEANQRYKDQTQKDNDKTAEDLQKANQAALDEQEKQQKELLDIIGSPAQKIFQTWKDELFKPLDEQAAKSKNIMLGFFSDIAKGALQFAENKAIKAIGNALFPEKKTEDLNNSGSEKSVLNLQDWHSNVKDATINIDVATLKIAGLDSLSSIGNKDINDNSDFTNSDLTAGLTGFGYGLPPKSRKRTKDEQSQREALINSEQFKRLGVEDIARSQQGTEGEISQNERQGLVHRLLHTAADILPGDSETKQETLEQIHGLTEKFHVIEALMHGHSGIGNIGEGSIAKSGEGKGLDIWGNTDLANVGTKVGVAFANTVTKTKDVGKDIGKNLLSAGLGLIPGGGIFSSLLSLIPGFDDGGYTGGKPHQVRGVVHGDEHVFTSPQLTSLFNRIHSSNNNNMNIDAIVNKIADQKIIVNTIDSHQIPLSVQRSSAQRRINTFS